MVDSSSSWDGCYICLGEAGVMTLFQRRLQKSEPKEEVPEILMCSAEPLDLSPKKVETLM